jgi:ribosomal protein S27E
MLKTHHIGAYGCGHGQEHFTNKIREVDCKACLKVLVKKCVGQPARRAQEKLNSFK